WRLGKVGVGSQQMKSPLTRALLLICGPQLTLYGLRFGRIALLRRQPGVIALRDDPLGVVRLLLGLGKQFQCLGHSRVVFGMCLHAFLLTKFVDEQFGLDIGFDPIAVRRQVRLGEGGLLFIQKLAEVLHHRVVNFKLLVDFVVDDVVLGEVEEGIFLQQRVLELVGFRRRDLHVGSDAAATVNGAPAVGHLDFVIGVIGIVVAIVIVIVVKRDAAVIALDQASARRVIFCRG